MVLLKIVIIIPTYNEEGHIEKTLTLLQAMMLHAQNHEYWILVFDSNSSDKTISIVKTLQIRCNNIILIGEERKSGLGSAYTKAMQYVIENLNADIVFEFDADGSHQPHYIPAMIEAIENGADVVMGSRYVPGGKVSADWAWYRHFISRLGNWIARILLSWKHQDLTTGFRATKTTFLKQVPLNNLLSKNYAYKLHLFWELHQLGAKIVEIPITFIDRQHGISKFPRNNILESLKVVILLRLRILSKFLQR
jgi:dolichol-phosphate mannosyltransferase